jgi:putative redox protein
VADVPLEKGGNGDGFGPHDLIEAALATCMAITVRKTAETEAIPLVDVRCDVRLDRTDPTAAVLRYALAFQGPLTTEQEARLREAASGCPVSRTLANGVRINASPAESEGRG